MYYLGVIHAHCTFSVKNSPEPNISKMAFEKFPAEHMEMVKNYLIHLDKVARSEVDEAKMTKEEKKKMESDKGRFEKYCKIEEAKAEVIEYATLHLGISCVHPVLEPTKWRPPYGQVW